MLFPLTAVAYAVSCALFAAYLWEGGERLERFAKWSLWLAATLHIAYHVNTVAMGERRGSYDIHAAMSALSLFVALGYLTFGKRLKLVVLGAFITPINLLLFLGAGLRDRSVVPAGVQSAILPLHISVNLLGYAAFTLAFAVAIAYLLQERQIKRKRIGGVFQRLPSLDTLDRAALRCVLVGFPLLTVGIVSGALLTGGFAVATAAEGARQAFAVGAWVVFAAVLLLRVSAGWRGRRGAIGTLIGFACACVVLVGYMLGDA